MARHQNEVEATVLILAADPDDRFRLRVDREIRSIQESLRRTKRDIRVEIATAARQEDARRCVLDHRPQIVHFCGHGLSASGLLFEGRDDRPEVVDPGALKQFFDALGRSVRCLVLSACYSADLAEVLVEHIDHVVGMTGEIEEATATEYSSAFYDAIGADGDVIEAHKSGLAAVRWEKLPGERKPVLRSKESARTLIFGCRSVLGLWAVPHSKNPYFTGRDEVLDQMRDLLDATGTSAVGQVQAISGLGGVGKTQLALHYCFQQRSKYPEGVLWVNAESGLSLAHGYFSLAMDLDLVTGDATLDDGIRALRRWLDDHAGWLLVFDNADKPDLLPAFLPTGGQGHVLVTSRATDFPNTPISDPLVLDVLSKDQALAFLECRVRRSLDGGERRAAEDLAKELGHLPLALEQAGAYVHQRKVGFASYLDAWFLERGQLELLERQQPMTGDYHRSIATTWRLNFRQVEALAPASADVLRIAAFLAPHHIPYELLVEAAEHLGPNLAELAGQLDVLALADLLQPLADFSLVIRHREERTFSIHRLVQAASRRELGEEESLAWLARAFEGLADVFPSGVFETWPVCLRLYQHVQALAARAETFEVEFEAAGSLLQRTGYFLSEQGQAQQARKLEEWAFRFNCQMLGKEHPDTLRSMTNLAVTIFLNGDWKNAEELQQQALDLNLWVLGEEHPGTLISMNNFALIVGTIGDPHGARALHEQILDVQCRVLGEEHPYTLTSMSNLALMLGRIGDTRGARELNEKTLDLRRRVLGEEHPNTLQSMNNLAAILQDLGDCQGAFVLHEQALEGRRRKLGEEHPDTLASMSHLAETLRQLGDVHGAWVLQKKALGRRSRKLGKEHPDTLQSMNCLAATLWQLYDLRGAREIQEQTLAIRCRKLGKEHPDTLQSMNNLAVTLQELGDTHEARALQEQSLTGRRRMLGEEHPDTLQSKHNLGTTLQDLGDLQRAQNLLREAADGAVRVLGENHPQVKQHYLPSLRKVEVELEKAKTEPED